ncbi:MAG: hypothetical protein IPH03_13765 [Tetrasphaera sp.]|nr:hypothetical protein [Tetrasphaera sp.]
MITTTSRDLRGYPDWTPSFAAWEMRGRFPDLLNHPASADAARRLYADDAQAMLDRMIAEKWVRANGIAGIFPGRAGFGDDTGVYADASRREVCATLHHLCQQGRHRRWRPESPHWPTSSRTSPRRVRTGSGPSR